MPFELYIANQCLSIETSLRRGSTKEAFLTIKAHTKTHPSQAAIMEDKKGEPLSEAQVVMGR